MGSTTIERESLVPLALLDAMGGEIEGKTRLQKLAFLLDEEELGDRFDAYSYRKYDYGPFSKSLLEDTESLEEKNLVEIAKQRTVGGNTRYDYALTDTGRDAVSQLSEKEGDISEIFEAAKEIVSEYGDLPLRDLIERVYENHSEYKENSVYQY
ncbi:helix-turn-helix transcriptional regulator [Halomicroarcula sp. F28]|uniref:helix-turn-helix transcriptional regulator n=1 Tax=Haloarcula salinisoli TaxID=2487746 RepID=UPI001C732CA4|nr:helix-turn-helix transcriptional regulator [Halomicroarcula salinisoli]MBX0286608.1 helix-turn-helix transcriptional regulator [Halomicroarcula salinisoli]